LFNWPFSNFFAKSIVEHRLALTALFGTGVEVAAAAAKRAAFSLKPEFGISVQ
jgi:hypothetical protein